MIQFSVSREEEE